ncbi:STAS domain-containing protein [Mycobacterium sp. 155]|uniref:STAS domain-containing protein n=1 Tax=Mycobacterium sp. 155 TaxID=1157943 RepID=UPI00037BAF58|nr:STAS domain-containing protein [Mycobacterium sp. 155]
MSVVNVPLTAGKQYSLRGDQAAGFSTHWVGSGTAVVTVYGELDAANARQFAEYTVGHISHSKELILDLMAVGFFSVSCFPALHNLNMRCGREGVGWVLIPSTAVARVLRVCDLGGQLPTEATVATALSALRGRRTIGSNTAAEAPADAFFAV